MEEQTIEIPGHHVKWQYCETRPKYRRGKRKTAVKVFTINQESKYIIIINVQATGLEKDLAKLCATQGSTVEFKQLEEYPTEPFTQAYIVKYASIHFARRAKRYLDERYFYGSMLHVFYAPEYETVEDIRDKLQDRRFSIVGRLRTLQRGGNKNKDKPSTPKQPLKETKQIVITDEPVAVWNSKPVYAEELPVHKLVPQHKVACENRKDFVEVEKPTKTLKRKFQEKSEEIQNKYKKSNDSKYYEHLPVAKANVFIPRSIKKK